MSKFEEKIIRDLNKRIQELESELDKIKTVNSVMKENLQHA